jgi:hypothetical protein
MNVKLLAASALLVQVGALLDFYQFFWSCLMLSQPKSAMQPRRLFLRIAILTCHQKSNPFDETVPLKFAGLLFKTCSSWQRPPTTPYQNWSTVKCGYSYSTALRWRKSNLNFHEIVQCSYWMRSIARWLERLTANARVANRNQWGRRRLEGRPNTAARLAGCRRVTRQVWFCRWWMGRTACLFRTVPVALTGAARLRADGIFQLLLDCKFTQPSVIS